MTFVSLWILTGVCFAVNFRFGGRVDRAALMVLLAGLLLTPWFYEVRVGGFRWAIAAIDMATFVGLAAITLSRQRWWLVPLSGFQLAAVMTHLLAGLEADRVIWITVTIRMVTWVGILLTLLAGAYEAWVVQRYDLWRVHNGQARPL